MATSATKMEYKADMTCNVAVFNLKDGQVIGFPVLLVFGRVTCKCFGKTDNPGIKVKCDVTRGHSSDWQVINGFFKALLRLSPGKNIIELKCERKCIKSKQLDIIYEPLVNRRYVRAIYVICKESDGHFDAPDEEDNDTDSALQRISLNASLLQTFMAENMHYHGFGKNTFRLEEDEDGNPKVHIFRSDLPVSKARQMNGDELYRFFYEELMDSCLSDDLAKLWVFMSCTKYCPPPDDEFDERCITDYVQAHTALGGGNMALFGTACIHTWPKTLDQVVQKFSDNRCIDRKTLFDDSCRRGTYWANYSTTLGAAMHELGHCFDLPHTPSGIMSRGFDDMNLFFLPHEINNDEDSSDNLSPYLDGGAHWHRSSAVSLSLNSWLRTENGSESKGGSPIVSSVTHLIGPVGAAPDDNNFNNYFDMEKWLLECNLKFGGIICYAGNYLDAFRAVGFKYNECHQREATYLSQIIGNLEGKKSRKFPFLLEHPEEKIEKIKIRAGCWIDGIQIFTNFKSSLWIGGSGGNLYEIMLTNGKSFSGLVAATGPFVGSLGIQLQRSSERTGQVDKETDNYFIDSSTEIKLVEARNKDGDVYFFKEYEGCSSITLDRAAVHCGHSKCVLRVLNVNGEFSISHLIDCSE